MIKIFRREARQGHQGLSEQPMVLPWDDKILREREDGDRVGGS